MKLAWLFALVLVAGAGTVRHADAQAPPPLVAILEPGPKATPSGGVQHFTEALADLGWVDGRTVRIETRYGEWEPERTTAMAQALLALRPDVLYTHSDRAARVAMRATTSVPIVVGASADLVAVAGLKSLARPGGNVTGVTANQPELDRKRLEVLKGAVPAITRVAYVFSPDGMPEEALVALEAAARRLGIKLQRFPLRDPGQAEAAFAGAVREAAQGVLVQDTTILARYTDRVIGLAARHRLPAISQIPGFAERGGLLQYGADVYAMFRQSAGYVDRILKGARPGDLPIEQPTRIGLIVNQKTAKALGIVLPSVILLRADQIIE